MVFGSSPLPILSLVAGTAGLRDIKGLDRMIFPLVESFSNRPVSGRLSDAVSLLALRVIVYRVVRRSWRGLPVDFRLQECNYTGIQRVRYEVAKHLLETTHTNKLAILL